MPKVPLVPDLAFPITSKQINPLMDCVQVFNLLDAGVEPRTQKALDVFLHIWELYAKTNGRIDYTGPAGHQRLFQDSCTLVPEMIITKHGDLRAAHLGLDFTNAQMKLKGAGFPQLTNNRDDLINQCRDILTFPLRTEDRMSLLLSFLGKSALA